MLFPFPKDEVIDLVVSWWMGGMIALIDWTDWLSEKNGITIELIDAMESFVRCYKVVLFCKRMLSKHNIFELKKEQARFEM